jgi:hypothetical protein
MAAERASIYLAVTAQTKNVTAFSVVFPSEIGYESGLMVISRVIATLHFHELLVTFSWHVVVSSKVSSIV